MALDPSDPTGRIDLIRAALADPGRFIARPFGDFQFADWQAMAVDKALTGGVGTARVVGYWRDEIQPATWSDSKGAFLPPEVAEIARERLSAIGEWVDEDGIHLRYRDGRVERVPGGEVSS